VGRRMISQSALLEAAARQEQALPPAPQRHVLVSAAPLSDPVERTLLAWATISGAALVLEPDPQQLAATVGWVRPTIFAGSLAELEALRKVVATDDRRLARRISERLSGEGKRLPWGRLQAIVLRDAADAAAAAAATSFWRQRGVAVVGPTELGGMMPVV
jgi:hypothetical protein